MAERKFWEQHGTFVLFSFLVLFGGLYVACSGSVGDDDLGSNDAGSDAPRSNR